MRGAPAIGIAAAYGVCLDALHYKGAASQFVPTIEHAISNLEGSRPTAVNLKWALTKMRQVLSRFSGDTQSITEQLIEEANALFLSDIEINRAIARNGLSLIPDNANIIHHCNTGSLATADYGTALGVVRYAYESGKNLHVFLDETRPRFQGSMLSAFELSSFKIPHTVIVDSASGHLMKSKKIDLCIVGCDRVAANGDTANKIGTYNLALVAQAHGVPFYIACPTSTIDLSTNSGESIEIELRDPSEITKIGDLDLAPLGTSAYNPAFDVTPTSLISGFITEKGVLRPPFADSIFYDD